MDMWYYILGGLIIAPFELLVVYLISKTIPKPKRERMGEWIKMWGLALGYAAFCYGIMAWCWIKRNALVLILLGLIAITFYLLGAL